MHIKYREVSAYLTKDGSEIRELIHPGSGHGGRQSLAEAIVMPAQKTLLHQHRTTEELYHVTSGRGLMIINKQTFPLAPGDSVKIAPGTPHCVENTGDTPLHILCCCCPPYSHEDTELLQSAQ